MKCKSLNQCCEKNICNSINECVRKENEGREFCGFCKVDVEGKYHFNENYECKAKLEYLRSGIKIGGLESKEDVINKPNHYHDSGVDPISIGEVILTKEEMSGFYKMNMLKYWYRAGKKDNNSKEQDIAKYYFYKEKLDGIHGKIK